MNTLLTRKEVHVLVSNYYSLPDIKSCTLIRRGFNDHYFIETENDRFIFRVYLNNKYFVDSVDAYRFELDLLDHLHANGVSVATAVKRKSGELLGSVDTEFGARAYALFRFVDGVSLGGRSIYPDQCFELGKSMACMHLAANLFNTDLKRYSFDRKYLIDEPLKAIEALSQKSPDNDAAKHGQAIIEKLQPIESNFEIISKISLDNDEFGIIHADLHLGNVHFLGSHPTMFDFDHCAYGWRAYDLAGAAYGLADHKREAVIEGYESVRPLSTAERDSLSMFANFRNLWDIGDIIVSQSMREYPS